MGGDAFGFLVKFCTDTRITALFLLLCLLVSLSFIIVRNSGLGRSVAQMACRRKEEKCRKGRPDGMNLSHAALWFETNSWWKSIFIKTILIIYLPNGPLRGNMSARIEGIIECIRVEVECRFHAHDELGDAIRIDQTNWAPIGECGASFVD